MQLFPIFSSCHMPASSNGTSGPNFISNTLPTESLPFSADGYSHLRHVAPLSVGEFGLPIFSFPNYPPLVIPTEPSESSQLPIVSPKIGKSNPNNTIQMVTIRMIMSGKEVGSIIGKKGENIKRIREESSARINISDGSCPERIVTVTGTIERIYSAFLMMCQKFEEDYTDCMQVNKKNTEAACPPVTLRLLVPATQCGSIIGKGGYKIKDIRENCGASIQVASELLPNSSERSVTVSGTASAVALCIQEISAILLEAPLKCTTIPYKPKSNYSCIHQSYSSPQSGPSMFPFTSPNPDMMKSVSGFQQNNMSPTIALYPVSHAPTGPLLTAFVSEPPPYNVFPPSIPMWPRQHQPLPYSMKSDSMTSSQTSSSGSQFTKEFNISNEMIGCIIGRGGTTINEIRSLSGAQIKISYCEENSTERQITITGSPESVNTAEMLINANIKSFMNSLTSNKSKSTTKSSSIDSPVVVTCSSSVSIPNSNTGVHSTETTNLTNHYCKLKSSCFPMNPVRKSHRLYYSPY